MDKTSVSYNRNSRKWELLGEIGEIIAEFPPGPAGRTAALVAQLTIEIPDLAPVIIEMESAMPSLAGRAVRAGQIIANNNVIVTPSRWRVRSQRRPRELYTVFDLTETGFRCTCKDYDNGAPRLKLDGRYQPVCKHILAVLLHRHRVTLRALATSDKPRPGTGSSGWWFHQKFWRDGADRFNAMIAAGEAPSTAAEAVDADFMPFEEWKQHHTQE
jgi:hypothetical protein